MRTTALAALGAALLTFAVVALATDGDEPAPKPATAAIDGRQVWAEMGCGSCHRLQATGSQGQVGPDLDTVLPNHTASSLHAVITRPPTGSMMPEDFAQRMSTAELDALVTFLMEARGGRRPSAVG